MKKGHTVRKQRGYTLLEYCAGAAVIAGLLVGVLTQLGTGLNTMMTGIGTWATARASSLNGSNSSASN